MSDDAWRKLWAREIDSWTAWREKTLGLALIYKDAPTTNSAELVRLRAENAALKAEIKLLRHELGGIDREPRPAFGVGDE